MKRQKPIQFEFVLSREQVRARVNRFILSEVGSQFCAGDPDFDMLRKLWRIPILFVTPGFVAGQVGEAQIDLKTGEIEHHTDIEQIYDRAEKLRKRHQTAIKAAFLRTGRESFPSK
jgi:hypothetical protein